MRSMWHRGMGSVAAVLLLLTGSGCISSTGLLQSLATDLALTTAAATQGLVSGLLSRLEAP